MYKEKSIYVIVPAFNEEGNLSKVIETMPNFVDRIVIVDDASTDNTYRIASSFNDSRITVKRHDVNMGVGASIITGHKIAIEENADISVVMAGDGQMDPKYLPRLLDPVIDGDYDYTKGNRFFEKELVRKMPKIRILGNMILTFLNKFASGYWNLSDPQNGYTAIKVAVLKQIHLENISHGYEFENDMLIHLNIGNFRVKDIPIPALYGSEKSKIKLGIFIPRILYFLIKGFFTRIIHKYFY